MYKNSVMKINGMLLTMTIVNLHFKLVIMTCSCIPLAGSDQCIWSLGHMPTQLCCCKIKRSPTRLLTVALFGSCVI